MDPLAEASSLGKTRSKLPLLLIFSAVALVAGLPTAACAELTCHDYMRGAQLEDPDTLERAIAIAQPLLQMQWRSMAMLNEAAQTVPYDGMWASLLLHQLDRDCEAIPDDTVNDIVATHLKVALAQKAAREAEEEEARKAQAEYEAPFEAKQKAVQEAINIAPPLPAHIAPVQAVVGKITCGQYLRYAKGSSVMDSEVGRAFTAVLQHAVDSDPVAKTAHIHYAGGRQYDGAYGYCAAHPEATLANALQEFVTNARSWSPAANHVAEQNRIDDLRAKPRKSRDEQEEILAYDAAEKAGAVGSCRWVLAYNDYLDLHHPENANDTSMAAERSRRIMAWCRIHPDASASALLASGVGE